MNFGKNTILTLLFYLSILTIGQAKTITQSTTASGKDNAPTRATITVGADCLTNITAISISAGDDFSDDNCGNWYAFDLYIDGTRVLENKCKTDIDAYTIPATAQTVSIESKDMDNYAAGDDVTLDFSLNIVGESLSPDATFMVLDDCNNNQYSVLVNVSSLNALSTIDIANQDGTTYQTGISSPGNYTVGPFSSSDPVVLELLPNGNASSTCKITSDNLQGCLPDLLVLSTEVSGYDRSPTMASITIDRTCIKNINSIVIDATEFDGGKKNSLSHHCNSWYAFDLYIDNNVVLQRVCQSDLEAYSIPSTAQTITITSVDIDYYADPVNALAFSLIIKGDFYSPNATFSVVEDCSNSQYTVDVSISKLGDPTTVDIVDLGGNILQQSISTTGTYTVGPFNQPQILEIIPSGNQNTTCKKTSKLLYGCLEQADYCNNSSAPHDDCANATLLDLSVPFVGSTACSYTPKVEEQNGSMSCGTIENNSWYQFIANKEEVIIDWKIMEGGNCTQQGIQLSVLEGTCGNLRLVGDNCINPTGVVGSFGQFQMSNLTIGQSYYLQVDGYSGDECNYGVIPISGTAQTPQNDNCPDDIPIGCEDIISADNLLATGSITCGGTTIYNEIWYSFLGDGKPVTLSVKSDNFTPTMGIFSGVDCDNLTCNKIGTSITIDATTKNMRYYIAVGGSTNTEKGTFDLEMSCSTCPNEVGFIRAK